MKKSEREMLQILKFYFYICVFWHLIVFVSFFLLVYLFKANVTRVRKEIESDVIPREKGRENWGKGIYVIANLKKNK